MGYETIEALTISIYRLTDELSSTAAENILLKRQVSELERKRPDVAEQARIEQQARENADLHRQVAELACQRDEAKDMVEGFNRLLLDTAAEDLNITVEELYRLLRILDGEA